MVQLGETGGTYVIAVEIIKACVTALAETLLLFPLGFDENNTPRGFNACESLKNRWQVRARRMKQGGVGKYHHIKAAHWQSEA